MGNIMELSKSKYCKGIQCPKILWLDHYKPEEAELVQNETVLETGTKVGELAREYFGRSVLVDFSYDKTEMVSKTKLYRDNGENNIAEAAFLFDDLYCIVDILHKNDDGWDIVEVKSSTQVTEVYIDDLSFQYYVLSNCGIKIKNAFIMYINNEYVRQGELDLHKLFRLEDFTKEAVDKYEEVKKNIARVREYLKAKSEPHKDIDCCCERPYECAYKKYCGKHLPEYSVFDLARMQYKKKYELYHAGIITYEDILKHPDKVNAKQLRQVDSVYYKREDEYKVDEIKVFLETLSYPVYHLDFETFQQAVPQYDGCSPYEQIPFQYSLHIEYEDGKLEHKAFLAKEGQDPRRALAEQLVRDIPCGVCVTAYNMSFERTVLKKLAESFEDLSEHLRNIHDNIHDLMIPFQKQSYYSAAMQGSYSIKYVLPALYPGVEELNYQNLEGVHNGAEAAAAFSDMENHSSSEIAKIRADLLKYCALDTYAMVKVLQKLKEVCG